MSFNTIQENKILTKKSVITVNYVYFEKKHTKTVEKSSKEQFECSQDVHSI